MNSEFIEYDVFISNDLDEFEEEKSDNSRGSNTIENSFFGRRRRYGSAYDS